MVANTLQDWAIRDIGEPSNRTRSSLHFLRQPREVLGEDGKVVGIAYRTHPARRHRNVRAPASSTTGTSRRSTARSATSAAAGRAAVRRASGNVPNEAGRVLDARRQRRPRHVRHRLDQARSRRPDRPHQGRRERDRRQPAGGPAAPARRRRSTPTTRPSSTSSGGAGIPYTTWQGWIRLDAHELALGGGMVRGGVRQQDRAGTDQGCPARGHDQNLPRLPPASSAVVPAPVG